MRAAMGAIVAALVPAMVVAQTSGVAICTAAGTVAKVCLGVSPQGNLEASLQSPNVDGAADEFEDVRDRYVWNIVNVGNDRVQLKLASGDDSKCLGPINLGVIQVISCEEPEATLGLDGDVGPGGTFEVHIETNFCLLADNNGQAMTGSCTDASNQAARTLQTVVPGTERPTASPTTPNPTNSPTVTPTREPTRSPTAFGIFDGSLILLAKRRFLDDSMVGLGISEGMEHSHLQIKSFTNAAQSGELNTLKMVWSRDEEGFISLWKNLDEVLFDLKGLDQHMSSEELPIQIRSWSLVELRKKSELLGNGQPKKVHWEFMEHDSSKDEFKIRLAYLKNDEIPYCLTVVACDKVNNTATNPENPIICKKHYSHSHNNFVLEFPACRTDGDQKCDALEPGAYVKLAKCLPALDASQTFVRRSIELHETQAPTPPTAQPTSLAPTREPTRSPTAFGIFDGSLILLAKRRFLDDSMFGLGMSEGMEHSHLQIKSFTNAAQSGALDTLKMVWSRDEEGFISLWKDPDEILYDLRGLDQHMSSEELPIHIRSWSLVELRKKSELLGNGQPKKVHWEFMEHDSSKGEFKIRLKYLKNAEIPYCLTVVACDKVNNTATNPENPIICKKHYSHSHNNFVLEFPACRTDGDQKCDALEPGAYVKLAKCLPALDASQTFVRRSIELHETQAPTPPTAQPTSLAPTKLPTRLSSKGPTKSPTTGSPTRSPTKSPVAVDEGQGDPEDQMKSVFLVFILLPIGLLIIFRLAAPANG